MMPGFISKPNLIFSRVVGLFVTVVALWGMIGHVIPFKPFLLRDYDSIPPLGCPNIPLVLTVHYDLIETPILKTGRYGLKTNWVELNTGSDTALEEYEGTFAEYPRGLSQRKDSPHFRVAPPLAGRWQVYTEMIVRGRVLGWPREQILPGRVYDNVFKASASDKDGCS